jgi:hypothetical protein
MDNQQGHSDGIGAVAYRPDGRQVLPVRPMEQSNYGT